MNAILKYGYSKFSIEILEYCSPEKCIEREQYYIDQFKPEYNISLTAGAPMTDRSHSEETKNKISESRKGILSGKNHPMFGINHSEETKQKISKSLLGRLHSEETIQKFRDRKFSEETKKKMSESLKGRFRPKGAGRPSIRIEVLDLETGTKNTYESMSDAARSLGVASASIRMYFFSNTQKPYKGRYKLSKV